MNNKLILQKGTVIPNHVAIILDGNRRWARSRGLHPWEGHAAGAKAIFETARAARELGIHTLTMWAFSTENWERPKGEINQIMKLVKKYLGVVEKEAHKDKIRFVHLGRKDRLPNELQTEIKRIENETSHYTKHLLNLALDYGGKNEIVRAVQKIINQGIPAEKVSEKLFEKSLDTHGQPYPYVDLFIRTSGEQRTSGLMPWQMEYAEYYWETDHLPDFGQEKLKAAILDYSRRRRRFGGNDTVEHFSYKPELAAKLEIAWWRLANIPEGMRFRDYAMKHLRVQYGFSKKLAIEAAKLLVEAILEEKDSKWEKAKEKIKQFYALVKDELKLAFEPEIVASLEIKLRKEISDGGEEAVSQANDTAKELYAEVYRISLFQAAKAAHLRVLASLERKMAESGMGELHWARAESYLQKFYSALKDRIA